jgi:hypothetical protein
VEWRASGSKGDSPLNRLRVGVGTHVSCIADTRVLDGNTLEVEYGGEY